MILAPECSFKWDGAALAIFLGAIPLAIALTIVTLFLYRWAIGRAMRTAARQAAQIPKPSPSSPPGHPMKIDVVTQTAPGTHAPPGLDTNILAMRRLSLAYVLAGVAHAIIATALLFWLGGLEFKPYRTLTVWTVFAWPVVAGLMMTFTATSRQQALLVGAYFGLLLLLDIAAEVFNLRYQSGFGELFVLWAITMGPPTAVVVLLANRAWRSVGLIALFISIVLVATYLLGFQLVGCMVLTTRSEVLLDSIPYLRFAIILVCGLPVWLLLRRAGRRYQAKQESDQMLTLDSWWLLVTALEILFEMGSTGGASFLFLLAFAGYKIVLSLSLPQSGRAGGLQRTPQSMLLLRVFGHSGRVRTLADQVGQIWRHAGPINMIGGTDLATALLEPDELMAFWSGKLRQGFVSSPADLETRLRNLDEKPDPDGRYRINEFFCHDNTWRATVRALAQRSAVVLMDLRGFGKENRGCEFELSMLLGEIPLERIVLLVDRSTSTGDLMGLLRSQWEKLPSSSPNRDLAEPVLHLFQVEDSGNVGRMSVLLSAACGQCQTGPGVNQKPKQP